MVVTKDERVGLLTFSDLGHTVVVAVLVSEIIQTVVDVDLVDLGEIVRGIYVRGERVEVQGSGHHRTVLGILGDGPPEVLFEGSVDTDRNPGLYLVISVDLGGDAVEHIGLSADDTVLVEIGERSVEVALVIASLETEGVALGRARSEGDVRPVGVGLAVITGKCGLGEEASLGHVADVLLGVHNLGNLGQRVDGILGIEEDAAVALAVTGLGGDEDDTVTCLGTVDSSRRSVLKDFDGLDDVRIEIIDAAYLETVDDDQRVGG